MMIPDQPPVSPPLKKDPPGQLPNFAWVVSQPGGYTSIIGDTEPVEIHGW